MAHKQVLGPDEVESILVSALAEARANRWRVTIAVVDDGGHLLGLRRDGAAPATAQIAEGKARTAALTQRETKFYEQMLSAGRVGFLTTGVGCLLEGGFPIIVDGSCLGAVGVSGVTSEQDAQVARTAIDGLLEDFFKSNAHPS